MVQALELRPLSSLLPSEFNPLNKQPLARWLLDEPDDEWNDRTHACGNVVVPCQAAAALQLVARMP